MTVKSLWGGWSWVLLVIFVQLWSEVYDHECHGNLGFLVIS